jgi:beta-phosphoglucomutase-like phosphatase (HAD superfamily)
MLDGVLLDWEGVLADTGAARRDALLCALADEGVPFDAASYDQHCLGLSVGAGAAAAVALGSSPDHTLGEIVAMRARRDFAARLAQGFALQPGAARVIDGLQSRTSIVIATAAGRAETEIALRLASVQDACIAIATADDVMDVAPSPELYRLALSRLERRRPVRRDRVVALLCSRPALRAARLAGVHTIAVGAPAHVALEADAALDSLDGATLEELAALVSQSGAGRR